MFPFCFPDIPGERKKNFTGLKSVKEIPRTVLITQLLALCTLYHSEHSEY